MSAALFMLMAALAACADNPRVGDAPVHTPARGELAAVGTDVSITVSNEAADRRFYVIIHSLSERRICFAGMAWEQGPIRFADNTVSLIDGPGSIRPVPASGPAIVQVSTLPPRAAVRSYIGYDQVPAELLAAPGPHMLLLSDQPFFCDDGENL